MERPTTTLSVALPPQPKPEDFGIEWEHGAYSALTGEGMVFTFQIKMYKEALASWEKVCLAVLSTKNSNQTS